MILFFALYLLSSRYGFRLLLGTVAEAAKHDRARARRPLGRPRSRCRAAAALESTIALQLLQVTTAPVGTISMLEHGAVVSRAALAAVAALGCLACAAWSRRLAAARGIAAVGTTNEAKLVAARRGLAQLPVWRGLVVSGVKVPSGVSEMPQDLCETMLGASNRACAALVATPGALIGIGLESGIFRAGGHTFDVCCCCIRDRESQTDSFGFGSSWQMPASVAERLDADASVTLCDAWRPLVPDPDPTGQGLLGQLSGGVTTRSTCEFFDCSARSIVSMSFQWHSMSQATQFLMQWSAVYCLLRLAQTHKRQC